MSSQSIESISSWVGPSLESAISIRSLAKSTILSSLTVTNSANVKQEPIVGFISVIATRACVAVYRQVIPLGFMRLSIALSEYGCHSTAIMRYENYPHLPLFRAHKPLEEMFVGR